MSTTCSKPVQILGFLVLVLFFLNFQFNERYGNRGIRTEQIASEFVQNVTTTEENIVLKGYLSSKLATTSRLANHIFELVSVYGMSKKLHRKPAIFIEDHKYTRLIEGMKKILPGILDKFEIFQKPPPLQARRYLLNDLCCVYDNPDVLRNITDEYLHLTGHFYQSWRYFDTLRTEILSFVKPPIDFSPLPKSDETNFITCVHIRRGDFVDGQHHASNEKFTRAAVEFIENTEKQKSNKSLKFLTVIMGDDASWEENIFPRVNTIRARKGTQVTKMTSVFVSDNIPQNDLAYARYHCDATLTTAPSSTFGWWIGYLSKGQTVYYQDIKSTKDVNYRKGHLKPEDFFPPRWTAINMEGSGKVVRIA